MSPDADDYQAILTENERLLSDWGVADGRVRRVLKLVVETEADGEALIPVWRVRRALGVPLVEDESGAVASDE